MELTWEGGPICEMALKELDAATISCHGRLSVGRRGITRKRRRCDIAASTGSRLESRAFSPIVRKRAAGGESTPARDRHLMAQLYRHLSKLSPDRRRTLINQEMTQTQRLALEQWMLQYSRKSAADARKHPCGDRPSTSKLGRRCQSVKRNSIVQPLVSAGCPCVHLGYHLYAQSSKCSTEAQGAKALEMLHELQARCTEGACDSDSFRQKVVAAFPHLRCLGQENIDGQRLPLIYLRTRISFSRDVRLSSPVRHSMDLALRDWHCLFSAWRASVFSGAKLRADCTPDAAEQQWKRTCKAWHDIWLECGRPASELRIALAAKEAKRRPRWQKAVSEWQRMQSLATCTVAKLFSATSHKAGNPPAEILSAPQDVKHLRDRRRKFHTNNQN